jgi:predicted CxxxxCH...CXXCH cytochrome family protein
MKAALSGLQPRVSSRLVAIAVALIGIIVVVALASCDQTNPEVATPTPASAAQATLEVPAAARPTPTSAAARLGPAPVSGTQYVHEPFGREQCGTCHDLRNKDNPTALWAASVVETCRLCHWQIIDAPQPDNIHPPFPQGECLACHTPHASDQAFLLREPPTQLCGECHAKPRQTHPPAAEGECILCHAGHGSEQKALLRETEANLCLRCHADYVTAANAFWPHAQMARDCTMCHDPHTGEMVDDVASEGCAQCHADVLTATPEVAHPPVQAGFCTLCHSFHQTENFALLAKPLPDICRDCHRLGNPVEQTHPDTAVGECSLCHAGHGSAHANMLRVSQPELCSTCHEDVSTHGNTDAAFHFTGEFALGCTDCHNPHGPVGNLALVRDEIGGNDITFTAGTGKDSFDEPDRDNSDDLCATCHTDAEHNRVPSNWPDVEHFEGGTCTNCHPHNHDDAVETVDGFVLSNDLCKLCHGTPPPPGTEDYPLDEAALPHPIHAAPDGYGFACEQCHNTNHPGYTGHNTTPPSFQDVWFGDFNPSGRFDPATNTCGGLYCHSNGAQARSITGAPENAQPVWTETGACGTCHGVTAETLDTHIHALHLRFAECSRCHTAPEPPTHVNRQVDFADGATLADTEVCAPCHAERTDELKQRLLQPQDES